MEVLYVPSKTQKICFTQKVNSFLRISSYTVSFPPPSLRRGIFKPYKLYSMTTSEYITAFNQYRMFVFHYCNKLIKNKADAEDITSQVFVSVWRNKDKVDANKIQPFLKTIAKNKCIDLIRHRNIVEIISSSTIDEDIEDAEEAEIISEMLSSIYNIIDALPLLQQKYIKLKYIDGYEPREIAKMLNRTSSTIRNQMFVALSKIREEIKNRGITLG